MNIQDVKFYSIGKSYQNKSHTSFKSKIIDAHGHIGFHDGQKNTKNNLDVFIKNKLPNGDKVEKILVSDLDVLHGVKDEYSGNVEALELLAKDKRYSIIASCNPKEGNVENIKKLFNDYPKQFIALKFHPEIQELEISDKRFIPYLDFAQKAGLPCLFHSSVITDCNGKLSEKINKLSDPQEILEVAKKYRTTPFVLAHMGAGWREAHDKTIDVIINSIKNSYAELYADISWVDIDAGDKNHILKAIKALKGIGDENWTYGDQSFRLIFGSDAPLARFNSSSEKSAIENYTKFINEIKDAIKKDPDLKNESKAIIKNLFYKNAQNLYLNKAFIKKTGLLIKK